MKKLFIIGFLLTAFLSVNAFAEGVPVQITGGKFHITRGPNEQRFNAQIETTNFTAASYVGGLYSPWYEVCGFAPYDCRSGKSFIVPQNSGMFIGGCIGDCDQFVSGPFATIGTSYEKAYYRGNLTFSRDKFFIPKGIKRKGYMYFKKPFTVSGNLQVCQETNIDRDCPVDKILFDGNINGKGTLTITMEIRIWNDAGFSYPYLFPKSFDYQFEK
jgi:hypothetical protein